MKVETLRWSHNKLEMIDQRILPIAFEYQSTNTVTIVEGIRSMQEYAGAHHGLGATFIITPDLI